MMVHVCIERRNPIARAVALSVRSRATLIASAPLMFLGATGNVWAAGADTAQGREDLRQIEQVVVTAQKREESIQDVAMSVQAASGDKLLQLGVNDVSQIDKIAVGFSSVPTNHGTHVYSIRSVGFQDNSLAGSPTVSVYLDEVPISFSSLTKGVSLDAQRVEVMKGPQGTLFGQNATGGAVNFVANKPTDTLKAGYDLSYGRFNTADLQGFLSGPLTETLSGRIAVRSLRSDDWQKGYTTLSTSGASDFLNGRASLSWQPSDAFSALLTLNAWRDKSDTQIPQFFGSAANLPANADPRVVNYPVAPRNARYADGSACVNASEVNPPFDQAGTTPWAPGTAPTEGTACTSHAQDNEYYSMSLRMDYDVTDDIVLTSITSYEDFDRYSPMENAGVTYQVFQSVQYGYVESAFQELRLAGTFGGEGAWIVGANYGRNKSDDRFLQTYGGGSVADVFGLRLGPTTAINIQDVTTWGVYASADHPITDSLSIQAGVRYNNSKNDNDACSVAGGDGTVGLVYEQIINYLQSTYTGPDAVSGQGVVVPDFGCITTGVAPTFNPPPFGQLWKLNLDEDNTSWQVGLKWDVNSDVMLYADARKGYKSGSFPTTGSALLVQLSPVVQESLLAYETGFKSSLLNDTLQLNGAAFYYDYKDKQVLGRLLNPVFGSVEALVNVPESHVMGLELSAVWIPVDGLTISPSISYQESEIDGCSPSRDVCAAVPASAGNPAMPAGKFHGFDPFGALANFDGQSFPHAPEVTAMLDVHYEWRIFNGLTAHIGGNVNYTDKTMEGFVNKDPSNPWPHNTLEIPSRTLVDLRAGVSKGDWRFELWGRNVTDEYYWTGAHHFIDTLTRYTGMPATYGASFSYRY